MGLGTYPQPIAVNVGMILIILLELQKHFKELSIIVKYLF